MIFIFRIFLATTTPSGSKAPNRCVSISPRRTSNHFFYILLRSLVARETSNKIIARAVIHIGIEEHQHHHHEQ